MADYRVVNSNQVIGSGVIPATKIVPKAVRVASITVLSLPAACVDPTTGLGYAFLHVGEGKDPIRINQAGMQWTADKRADGSLAIEEDGVFVSSGGAAAPTGITGIEFYIGSPPQSAGGN